MSNVRESASVIKVGDVIKVGEVYEFEGGLLRDTIPSDSTLLQDDERRQSNFLKRATKTVCQPGQIWHDSRTNTTITLRECGRDHDGWFWTVEGGQSGITTPWTIPEISLLRNFARVDGLYGTASGAKFAPVSEVLQ